MIFQHWENKLSRPLPETGLVLVAAEGRVGRCRKGGSRGCAQASCPTYMMASGSLFLLLVGDMKLQELQQSRGKANVEGTIFGENCRVSWASRCNGDYSEEVHMRC